MCASLLFFDSEIARWLRAQPKKNLLLYKARCFLPPPFPLKVFPPFGGESSSGIREADPFQWSLFPPPFFLCFFAVGNSRIFFFFFFFFFSHQRPASPRGLVSPPFPRPRKVGSKDFYHRPSLTRFFFGLMEGFTTVLSWQQFPFFFFAPLPCSPSPCVRRGLILIFHDILPPSLPPLLPPPFYYPPTFTN